MRLASIYQTDHEEPIYLEYTLLDASGDPVIPADLARPSSDRVEAPIDAGLPKDSAARRESVVVPAGTSDAYAWNEDELEP